MFVALDKRKLGAAQNGAVAALCAHMGGHGLKNGHVGALSLLDVAVNQLHHHGLVRLVRHGELHAMLFKHALVGFGRHCAGGGQQGGLFYAALFYVQHGFFHHVQNGHARCLFQLVVKIMGRVAGNGQHICAKGNKAVRIRLHNVKGVFCALPKNVGSAVRRGGAGIDDDVNMVLVA